MTQTYEYKTVKYDYYESISPVTAVDYFMHLQTPFNIHTRITKVQYNYVYVYALRRNFNLFIHFYFDRRQKSCQVMLNVCSTTCISILYGCVSLFSVVSLAIKTL